MSDDYEVGYGKPPKHSQFKKGNNAAKGRRKPRQKPFSLPDIFGHALRAKRKIKRGEVIVEMTVAEILTERIIQIMLTGTGREVALMMAMIERHAPAELASAVQGLKVLYQSAEGSAVPLPSPELFKGKKKP